MNMCSKPPEMGASLGEDRGLSVIPSCIVYRRRCHWQSVGWLLAGQFLTEASASEDIRRLWFFTVNISLTTSSRCWEQFLTSTCWAIELKTSFISLNGSVWWCFKRQFNLSVNWSQELNCLSIFSFNYFTCSSQCVVMSFGKNVKGGLSSFVAALLPPQVTRFFFLYFSMKRFLCWLYELTKSTGIWKSSTTLWQSKQRECQVWVCTGIRVQQWYDDTYDLLRLPYHSSVQHRAFCIRSYLVSLWGFSIMSGSAEAISSTCNKDKVSKTQYLGLLFLGPSFV